MALLRTGQTNVVAKENGPYESRGGRSGKPGEITQRAALGSIGNRHPGKSHLPVLQKPGGVTTRAMGKSSATTCLQNLAETESAKNAAVEGFTRIPTVTDAVQTYRGVAPTAETESLSAESETESGAEDQDMSVQEARGSSPVRVSRPPGVRDIDANDGDNPQLVSEYILDIYDYLRFVEHSMPVRRRYLDAAGVGGVTGKMRAVLVDWMVQVHLRFHLLQETLYLTVAVMDRFLQDHPVTKNQLQLVGVTSMLVASKYEEMYAPEIQDFIYITDNTYTKSQILDMEQRILVALEFNLGRPLPLHFLRRFSKAWEVDAKQHTLAKYFMELMLTQYETIHIPPSHLAASSLCLAAHVFTDSEWDATMEHYTGYREDELTPLMTLVANTALKTKLSKSKFKAVKTKYSNAKMMSITECPELESSVMKSYALKAEDWISRV